MVQCTSNAEMRDLDAPRIQSVFCVDPATPICRSRYVHLPIPLHSSVDPATFIRRSRYIHLSIPLRSFVDPATPICRSRYVHSSIPPRPSVDPATFIRHYRHGGNLPTFLSAFPLYFRVSLAVPSLCPTSQSVQSTPKKSYLFPHGRAAVHQINFARLSHSFVCLS